MQFFVCESSEEEEIERPNPMDFNNKQKVRNFEHEAGNWASYIFCQGIIEPDNHLISKINNINQNNCFQSMGNDFHISLTNTFVVKYHWMDSFITAMMEQAKFYLKFTCYLGHPLIYVNEDKTRTFIGLEITSGFQKLQELSTSIYNFLNKFNIESQLFKEPSFHISICWAFGDVSSLITEVELKLIQEICDKTFLGESIYIERISCKLGNKLYHFELK